MSILDKEDFQVVIDSGFTNYFLFFFPFFSWFFEAISGGKLSTIFVYYHFLPLLFYSNNYLFISNLVN